MKNRFIDKFSLGMYLILFLVINYIVHLFFLDVDIKSYNPFLIDDFIIFKRSTFVIVNIFLVLHVFFDYRGKQKYEKALDESTEREEIGKLNYIKKYLSSEEYKNFQETLNDIPENEKYNFKDLIFSELLKKQAEKYIKGGNDK